MTRTAKTQIASNKAKSANAFDGDKMVNSAKGRKAPSMSEIMAKMDRLLAAKRAAR
jgi:hypothetical protein